MEYSCSGDSMLEMMWAQKSERSLLVRPCAQTSFLSLDDFILLDVMLLQKLLLLDSFCLSSLLSSSLLASELPSFSVLFASILFIFVLLYLDDLNEPNAPD